MELFEELAEFGGEIGGERRDVAGGELAEVAGELGERRRVVGERGEGFFLSGAEVGAVAAGLGAGDGELLEGSQHLSGHAATTAGAAFEFFEQSIPFCRPLGGGAGVASGGGDLGESVVILPCFLEPEGFTDLAGGVGVAFGSVEDAETQMDDRELAQRSCFEWFVLLGVPDLQALCDGAAGGLEVLAGRGLVASLAGGFAFALADDADVLRGGPEAGLILQLIGQLAGLLVPGPRLGQTTGILFDDAE